MNHPNKTEFPTKVFGTQIGTQIFGDEVNLINKTRFNTKLRAFNRTKWQQKFPRKIAPVLKTRLNELSASKSKDI